MFRNALAFGALSLAALAGPAAAACKVNEIAQLPVTMEGNSPTVSVTINGVDAKLIADTGASFSFLTPALAAKAKLHIGPLPFGYRVGGVNGEADVGLTTVKDFGVVGATLHDWQFLVGGSRIAGDGLLGQNLLTVLDAEFDLANGVIRLFKTTGCGSDKALAYWAANQPYSVLDLELGSGRRTAIIANASVDGRRIKVKFDSGAYRSLLSLGAARAAGVDINSPGVQFAGVGSGLGRTLTDRWIAPFESFKIGDEEIKNTRLRIGTLEDPDADMLLGADFFLSHRIFVSRAQGRIYFTYNGGQVFRLDRPPDATPKPARAAADGSAPSAAAPAAADEPKDADGFARRAGARAARGDIDAAIADLGQAITLDPDNPRLLYERSQLYLRQRKAPLALADLLAALKIDPHFPPALMQLGVRSLQMKDEIGARANFESAVAANPGLAMSVAGIYADQGWFERSIQLWDQWIAAHGQDDRLPDALNGRCWARALWGHDLDKALSDCNRAVGMSRISSFLDSRGLVHLRLGHYDQAISDYTAALKDNPREAWSLYGRGLAELKKGEQAQGDADIKAAVAINPRLPDLAKKYGIAG